MIEAIKNKERWYKKAQQFVNSSLWILTRKEITDHIKSYRFNILMVIILLTCVASLYTAFSSIRDVASNLENNQSLFLYLRVFTITGENGTLPSFVTFISFLGPLLGISLGFDAINSERNKNTLLRIMSQPIPRDYIILSKFLGSLAVIAGFIFSLGFLVVGIGIISMGIPPTFGEIIRIVTYLVMIIIYVGFWLSLSILFSIRFKQAATSALAGIAIWLFFSIFYSIIVNLIVNASVPNQLFQAASTTSVQAESQQLLTSLMRFSPNYLFSEITTILLIPNFRTLGPISMEQLAGSVSAPLDLAQSFTIIWPQVIGILSAGIICFAISYFIFLFQEIRS
ncbi:ABC-2 type transport system permease protein [Salinibacillus kushneri]|uniref:ABC-2 type transport system permease protein n=1 Tax=Salinibacillus kushneri TaxID=237682 RepID=A0A1I0AXE1_9BACI|nr:ABC transporter permease subunit [Salinibacillus kushneri]SES99061.1 ABC-2 type transport system permease protein [Salinibacillus kushneri]